MMQQPSAPKAVAISKPGMEVHRPPTAGFPGGSRSAAPGSQPRFVLRHTGSPSSHAPATEFRRYLIGIVGIDTARNAETDFASRNRTRQESGAVLWALRHHPR